MPSKKPGSPHLVGQKTVASLLARDGITWNQIAVEQFRNSIGHELPTLR